MKQARVKRQFCVIRLSVVTQKRQKRKFVSPVRNVLTTITFSGPSSVESVLKQDGRTINVLLLTAAQKQHTSC
jgi:hypothetical protein